LDPQDRWLTLPAEIRKSTGVVSEPPTNSSQRLFKLLVVQESVVRILIVQ